MARRTKVVLLSLTLSIPFALEQSGAQTSGSRGELNQVDLSGFYGTAQEYNLNSAFAQTYSEGPSQIRTGIFGGEDVDMALFSNFGSNALHSFTGTNMFYQLAAVAATPIIVNNNIDYHIERFFNEHPAYGNAATPVPFVGQALPFIAGGALLGYASLEHDDEVLGASFAVIQASLLELMDNVTLKAITGRPGPNWRKVSNMEDLSEEFRFGFLRGGVYNGWPSGHTGASMAVVSALTSYYPDNVWLKIAGYSLVAYVGDGSPDFVAAEAADLTFTIRGSKLSTLCEKRKIPHHDIGDFAEVVKELRGWR